MKVTFDKPTKGRTAKRTSCGDIYAEVKDLYRVLEEQATLNDLQLSLNCRYKNDMQRIVNYITQIFAMIVGAMILLAITFAYAIYINNS